MSDRVAEPPADVGTPAAEPVVESAAEATGETDPGPVLVVGAGPVGVALAAALDRAGMRVVGIHGRRPEAVAAAAARAGVAALVGPLHDLVGALSAARVLLLAVRDDALPAVAAALAGAISTSGQQSGQQVALHCSGATPSAQALAVLRPRLAGVGTLHPLRAFVRDQVRLPRLAGTLFVVEGDAVARSAARAMVTAVGGRLREIRSSDQALYHAAAVLAGNAGLALLAAGVEVLRSLGFEAGEAVEALGDLVESGVEQARRVGFPAALTGPMARGDVSAVRRHLEALVARQPRLLPLYRAVGMLTLRIAEQKGQARPEDLERIRELLELLSPLGHAAAGR